MTRTRAVVLDVDGTLVDSERDGHRVAFNRAFGEAGLSDHWDVDTYGRLLRVTGGRRRLDLWFRSRGHAPTAAAALAAVVHARKTELMRDLAVQHRVPARAGVRELLDHLAASGLALHVATTGTRAWVEPLLEDLFGPVFGHVVTGDDVATLKPHPAAYEEVLRRAGLSADQAVAVEDSRNGLVAATAAGLRCVVVRNSYTAAQDFSGADLVVDEFTDPALLTALAG